MTVFGEKAPAYKEPFLPSLILIFFLLNISLYLSMYKLNFPLSRMMILMF